MTPRLVVPEERRIELLAPRVQAPARAVLAGMQVQGFKARIFETLRVGDRQGFLAGKGRSTAKCTALGIDPKWAWPDCPDGIVTQATTLADSMHAYGVAVDIVENDDTPWTASQAFWNALGVLGRTNGFRWGGDWKFLDLPHLQWQACPLKPDPMMRGFLARNDLPGLWKALRLG